MKKLVATLLLVSSSVFCFAQQKGAILYAVFSRVVIGLYYLIGLLIGAIALVIVIFIAMGSGGKSGLPSGTPLYNSSGMFVGNAS